MTKHLVFTASWCQPCKSLKHTIGMIEKMNGDLGITYLDIDENSDLVQKYAIRSVPTIITLEDEKEAKRRVGSPDFHEVNLYFSGE